MDANVSFGMIRSSEDTAWHSSYSSSTGIASIWRTILCLKPSEPERRNGEYAAQHPPTDSQLLENATDKIGSKRPDPFELVAGGYIA
jgi:hypothetical protein